MSTDDKTTRPCVQCGSQTDREDPWELCEPCLADHDESCPACAYVEWLTHTEGPVDE